MRQTYLSRLYHYKKSLFWTISLFAALTVACNLAGDEITPFFVWGMYSLKISDQPAFEVYKIETSNGQTIDYTADFPEKTRFYLTSPISYYATMLKDGGQDPTLGFLKNKLGNRYNRIERLAKKITNDSTAMTTFPAWYERYISRVSDQKLNIAGIRVVTVHYDAQNNLVEDSSHFLIHD